MSTQHVQHSPITSLLCMCFLSLSLASCNPFTTKQQQTRSFMDTIDTQIAEQDSAIKSAIHDIKDYTPYHYTTALKDPFQRKPFVGQTTRITKTREQHITIEECRLPQCEPPTPHKKSLLENYDIHTLAFAGTLSTSPSEKIALIKTPDYGTIQVRIGDYIGLNNGKIIDIQEYSLVLEEKIYHNAIWQSKNIILTIQ